MYISINCLQLKKIVVLGNLKFERTSIFFFFFICVLNNSFFIDFFFAFGKLKDFLSSFNSKTGQ